MTDSTPKGWRERWAAKSKAKPATASTSPLAAPVPEESRPPRRFGKTEDGTPAADTKVEAENNQ